MNYGQTLKDATKSLHDQVDHQVSQMLHKQPKVITLAFTFWYQWLAKHAVLPPQDLPCEKDLFLERLIDVLPDMESNPIAQSDVSTYEQIGMYYVARGSAMGSRIVAKQLDNQHPLYDYYQYMAGLDIAPFLELKKQIDATDAECKNQIIFGAKSGFEKLLDCLDFSLKVVSNELY